MSCFPDDCCQQPEATSPEQTTACSEMSKDLEMPDEPPEFRSVKAVESMTSLPTPSDAPPTARRSSLGESLAKTDFAVLRGITLRESLRMGGNLWRTDPQYLKAEARAALFRRSRPVQHLDRFISHSWASKGNLKVLSLLMQSGCNHALLFWFLGMLIGAALSLANWLPMSFTYNPGTATFEEDCPLGPWVMTFGALGMTLGLVVSPYLPGCTRDMCFIDVACVHQADEELTRRGIRGIGGFLLVAKELHILWSQVYMSRLWCVFEVATYKMTNPEGRVVMAPIFLETIVSLFYATTLGGTFVYWTVRGTGYSTVFILLALVVSVLPFLGTIQLLRKSYVQRHHLFADFENFDLDSVKCFSDADRDFIHSAMAKLYGSNEAFTKYVQGPLREELLGPMTRSWGPERYRVLIASPMVSLLVECLMSLSKGGAPSDVVLLYVVSVVVIGYVYIRSAFNLLVLLCDLLAEPLVQHSTCFDYLQTFMIFLAYMIYFVLGSLLCMLPYLASRWELVPGIFIGFACLLFVVNWLQRKCDARRMVSKTPATAQAKHDL